jgi:prophage tail gpP-like protein
MTEQGRDRVDQTVPELGEGVELYVAGKLIHRYTQYNFTRGVMEQPATFSFTFGSGDIARDLLVMLKPLTPVQLKVGGTLVFTGVLEDPSCDNSSGATEITLQGRDMMYRLVKNSMRDERQWSAPTYIDLTRMILKYAGYKDDVVIAGNDANIAASSRVKAIKKSKKRRIVETIQTNMVSASGAKISYETVTGHIGESCFDFLVRNYKRAGLYLMCGYDGKPILTIPDADLQPHYALTRYRGIPHWPGTILSHNYTNRTSGRHANVKCCGKGRPDKHGQLPIVGSVDDIEMKQMGFGEEDCLTLHDSNAVDIKQCEHIAKRHLAAERRANRTLSYVTPGHVVRSLVEPGKLAIWTPDTTVRVDDDELGWPSEEQKGIHENCYLEKVDLYQSANGGTFSRLHLMRWSDIQYLGDDADLGIALEATSF